MTTESLETRKMNLRLTIKALTRNQSRLACRMAEDVGITGDFFHDQIDLSDYRIDPTDSEKYQIVTRKLNKANVELERLDYKPARFQARRDAYDFISLLSLEESILFLRKAGCDSTIDLVEKLIDNPNLIEEVVL